MRSPVLVVGTGRSGTSVTARVLHEALGVDMGGSSYHGPPNPRGDYEDPRMKEICRTYINGMIRGPEWKGLMRRAAADRTPPWGFKHPASAQILDELLGLWPDAAVVWAMRDNLQSARSCARHYGWAPDVAIKYILQRQNWLWEHLKDRLKGVLIVSFSEHRDEEILARVLREFLEEEP